MTNDRALDMAFAGFAFAALSALAITSLPSNAQAGEAMRITTQTLDSLSWDDRIKLISTMPNASYRVDCTARFCANVITAPTPQNEEVAEVELRYVPDNGSRVTCVTVKNYTMRACYDITSRQGYTMSLSADGKTWLPN